MHTAIQAQVQQIINELTETDEELGLQVAAYLDGELIVDAWAGIADESTGRLVDGDTLFTSWSTTKGFAATCIHILADRNQLAYDTPIAQYWPEFAANGKAAVTVRHALTHTAGIPQMPVDVTPEMMTDWDAMCRAIAGHAPLWVAGTTFGYHAWTFGWILGEIVRRVDGRPIAQFAQEELCRPLGITGFHLGLPDSAVPYVAPLRDRFSAATEAGMPEIALQVFPPHLSAAAVVNRPDIRRAVIPGAGGIMNARSIARHYAMLAGHGELAGQRILSAERIDHMRTPQTEGIPDFFGGKTCFGMGYFLGGAPEEGRDLAMGQPGTFGHGGHGGSLGYADPEHRFAFGLTKNLLRDWDQPSATTSYRVAEAIRQQLAALAE